MIAATWAWLLAGVGFVVVAGLLVFLVLGALGTPSDFLRRTRQTAAAGGELPGEVPTASAEETAHAVDEPGD